MNLIIAQVTTTTSSSGNMSSVSPVVGILFGISYFAVIVGVLVASWKVFTKAGRPGWATLIPIYNTVTLLHMTGRSGWLVLALCVPFWNLYVGIRLVFNLAQVFGRGIGFGFGLLFLGPIFIMILGFGNSQYVGPNRGRSDQFPSAGLAPAPLAS